LSPKSTTRSKSRDDRITLLAPNRKETVMILPNRPRRTRIAAGPAVAIGLALEALIWQAPPASGQDQATAVSGQETDQAAERRKALAMSYEHRNLEALPLLEALAAANPTDTEVREQLAVSLVAKAATTRDEEASALLKRARLMLLALKRMGKASGLGEILADSLPPDGRLPTFSTRKEVQAAMTEGEGAFSRRDFEAARRAYQRAIALDPHLYEASLFVGDTYFGQKEYPPARDWFARAVLIDPNRDEALRYLGDAQVAMGDMASARNSYLDAFIAEPYVKRTWAKLVYWCKENWVVIGHPQIVPRELTDEPNETKDARRPDAIDDGRIHWRRYAETRAAWAGGRFKTSFPNEEAYRHSLAEEADALRQVARGISADVKAGKIKQSHPSFANLMRLDQEGLLEAYILFARADEGISHDYAPYRAAHRGELRRYLSQYVVPVKDEKGARARAPLER
jgi:tetratricopeptide (TPR) repeat protein